MNKEIQFIAEQLKDAFEGDPWFGRPGSELISEITEDIAFERLNGQHSILELIWHMINWKEFTIYCLSSSTERDLRYFEENDWRDLDHSDKMLLQKGKERLQKTQEDLVNILQVQQDTILENIVPEKTYTFRKLLHGVLQHDIYHLGQIAYIKKLLRK